MRRFDVTRLTQSQAKRIRLCLSLHYKHVAKFLGIATSSYYEIENSRSAVNFTLHRTKIEELFKKQRLQKIKEIKEAADAEIEFLNRLF
jgi:DNA-binding XRE family transcriptional regulator